ncbi:MAG: YcxB family protein [Oscillospiraceae bacterium]|nr:YcxB family protein [Oscillospiraceae bacterium]
MENEQRGDFLYELETCLPERFFIKEMHDPKLRIFTILRRVLFALIILEHVILLILDDSAVWCILPLVGLFWLAMDLVFIPHKRRQRYQKIHEAGEDYHHYIFYEDHVEVSSPTAQLSLTYDTAESYTEDDERLMLFFQFGRALTIDKSLCDEEMLTFFRDIVPVQKQRTALKKTRRRLIVRMAVLAAYLILCTFLVGLYVRIERNTYHTSYPGTTYESFAACVEDGTIKDVVIIRDRFVEYTYTGHRSDERYYTECPEDVSELTTLLDRENVNWRTQP